MSHRLARSLVALLALTMGCSSVRVVRLGPQNLPAGVPAQPAAVAPTLPPPLETPGPGALPAPFSALTATVTFPPGTLTLLARALRPGTPPAPEVSAADLERLVITLAGQRFPLQIANVRTAGDGSVRFEVQLQSDGPLPLGDLEVATPDRALVLLARLDGRTASPAVDLTSTATALLARKNAAGLTIPPVAVQLLAERLATSLVSTTPGDPLEAPLVAQAVKHLLKAIGDGVPDNVLPTIPLQDPATGGGWGGGGGGSGGGGGPVVTFGVSAVSPIGFHVGQTPTLTITGTAFDAGATVTVGGENAPVLAVTATQITCTAPAGLAAGFHDLVVTNPDASSATLIGEICISPGTGTPSGPYVVGDKPYDIAVDRRGHVWVALQDKNAYRISNAGTVSGPHFTGNNPLAVATDSLGNAWVACNTSHVVTKLDPDGNTLGHYPVSNNPQDLLVDPQDKVWVRCFFNPSVIRLDQDGNTETAITSTPQASQLLLQGDTHVVFATSNGLVDRISLADLSRTSLDTGDSVFRLVAGPTHLWSFYSPPSGPGRLIGFDPASTKLGPHVVGGFTTQVAVDHQGNVWTFSEDGLRLTSPTGQTLLGPIDIGGLTPRLMALDPAGNVWLCGDDGSGTTNGSVYRCTPDGTLSGPIAVGQGPQAMAIDRWGNVWIACRASDNVYKIAF